MSTLLLLTNALQPSSEVLPALGLLLHKVRVAPAEVAALLDAPPADAVLVDGRRDLAHARSLCQLLRTTGLNCPLFLVMTEGGLSVVTAEWGIDDVLLDSTGPGEVTVRRPLVAVRSELAVRIQYAEGDVLRAGVLSIDEATDSAR